MFNLSGLVEVLFLQCLTAFRTRIVMSIMLCDFSLCIDLSPDQFVFVNCLLNKYVICFSVAAALVLKATVPLYMWGFLLEIPCTVHQSMCVLRLRSQCEKCPPSILLMWVYVSGSEGPQLFSFRCCICVVLL